MPDDDEGVIDAPEDRDDTEEETPAEPGWRDRLVCKS
jgi:hypothetical protein